MSAAVDLAPGSIPVFVASLPPASEKLPERPRYQSALLQRHPFFADAGQAGRPAVACQGQGETVSSLRATPSLPPYEATVRDLDLPFNVSVLRDKPAELAGLLSERIKLAAKYLGKTSAIQHSAALEAAA